MIWFKNLRIKSKLLSSFAVVIVFTIVLAIVAVSTVNRIDNSYTYLLDFPQKRYEYLMRMESNCISMRQASTAIVLNVSDSEKVDSYWKQFSQAYDDAVDNIEKYLERNSSDTVRDTATIRANGELVTNIKSMLDNYRLIAKRGMETALATGDAAVTNPVFVEAAPLITEATDAIKELLPKAAAYTLEVSEENTLDKDSSVLLPQTFQF